MSKFEIEYFSFLSIKPWIWLGFHTGMELWDYGMGRRIHRFEEFESPIRCLDFHRSLPLLFSGGDKTVTVWGIGASEKKKVSPIPLRKITTVFVSADEVIHFGQKKSLFFSRVNAILKNIHDNGTEWAALHRSIPPIFSVSDDSQLKMLRMNDTEGLEMQTLKGEEEFNHESVIYVKDWVFEILSKAWVSCTAIVAFCTPEIGVLATESRVFNEITRVGTNGFDKVIFISSKVILAGMGRKPVFLEVKAALPVLLGDRDLDFETLDQAIQDVVRTINHILIYRHPVAQRRDYSGNDDGFVFLLLVKGEFGVVRIEINADRTEFVGQMLNEGFLNEGCGTRAMERYQRRHPINLDIADEDDLAAYAINCIISAVERNPVTCGGDIQLFVIKKRERVTTYTCYFNYEGGNPRFEVDNYEHE